MRRFSRFGSTAAMLLAALLLVALAGFTTTGLATRSSSATQYEYGPSGAQYGTPTIRSAPRILGRAQVGETLQLDTGAWTTATPLVAVHQEWLRCDRNGNGCAPIPGATGRTYRVGTDDLGHRLRARVTAVNRFGQGVALSETTPVVVQGASVPVASLALPHRLVIDAISFNPPRIQRRGQIVTLRVHVRDTSGSSVSGALVFARGVPANRVAPVPERPTGGDGWATFTFRTLPRLPFVRNATLVFFLRARKPQGSVLGGISTRRLVQVRIQPQ